MTNMMFVFPAGDLTLKYDENTGSSKVFTVPDGKKWIILWIYVEVNTTATVGTRTVRLQYRDSADDVIFQQRGINVSESASGKLNYIPMSGGDIGSSGGEVTLPIPFTVLTSGYDIRIVDTANVDANDTINVQMMVLEVPN